MSVHVSSCRAMCRFSATLGALFWLDGMPVLVSTGLESSTCLNSGDVYVHLCRHMLAYAPDHVCARSINSYAELINWTMPTEQSTSTGTRSINPASIMINFSSATYIPASLSINVEYFVFISSINLPFLFAHKKPEFSLKIPRTRQRYPISYIQRWAMLSILSILTKPDSKMH